MAKVKGSVFGPRLKYIKSHANPEQEKAIWDGMSEALRNDVTRVIISQWYPFEHYLELNRAIVKELGHGNMEILHDVGRYSADDALHGIYKLFFKVGSPNIIIKAATSAWNQYFQNGVLSVNIHSAKSLTMMFQNVELLSQEHFISVRGWVQRVLELSGGKNVRVAVGKLEKLSTTLEVSWE
jgi:hypothetical protein